MASLGERSRGENETRISNGGEESDYGRKVVLCLCHRSPSVLLSFFVSRYPLQQFLSALAGFKTMKDAIRRIESAHSDVKCRITIGSDTIKSARNGPRTRVQAP